MSMVTMVTMVTWGSEERKGEEPWTWMGMVTNGPLAMPGQGLKSMV